MQVLLEIEDSKSAFILELLGKIDYVKSIVIDPMKNAKPGNSENGQKGYEEWEAGFRESLRELKLYKEGKIELKRYEELWD
jgi:hypothetical protein